VTVSLWRIATDAREYESDDLSGKGAEKSGGRWNRPGLPAVYCAGTISLACLETVVHLKAGGLPLNRTLVRIDILDEAWAARTRLTVADLAVGWDAVPESKVSLDVGDAWLKGATATLLEVPSAIVVEEPVFVINPRHADARGVRAFKVRRWTYDGRLRPEP
jgi:RES domain-containing protein